ncbi:MAG: SDR family oxidoreductase [Anaerolineae bacterium]|nr:SDR family oxidoreductase [Anaerolineae bacterium]
MQNSPKRVIITGASSGIGKAAAVRFAAEGWEVCLVARREALLQEIFAGLPAGKHLICPGAYEDPTTARKIHDAIRSEWGSLDVLVNNAGVFMTADAVNSPLEEWRKPFDIMVNGAVSMTRLAAGLMNDGGRIIHVTSIHGDRVEAKASAYAMAKAAINHYCRGLALELAPRNILVNAIAPGFVDTPMSVVDGVNELEGEWFRKNYIEGHHLPLRRAAQPEEIASVAFFLAGPDSSYMTGQVLTVDGGLTITF